MVSQHICALHGSDYKTCRELQMYHQQIPRLQLGAQVGCCFGYDLLR